MWVSRRESELGSPALSEQTDSTSMPSPSSTLTPDSTLLTATSRGHSDIDVESLATECPDGALHRAFSLRYLSLSGGFGSGVSRGGCERARSEIRVRRANVGRDRGEIRQRQLSSHDRGAAYRKGLQVPPPPQRNMLSSVRKLMPPRWHGSSQQQGRGGEHQEDGNKCADIGVRQLRRTRKHSPRSRPIASNDDDALQHDQRQSVSTGRSCVDGVIRVGNFHRALDNELVERALQAFCKRTWSLENVAFVRQVHELEKLSSLEGTTAPLLREKLSTIAETFVRPGCATEVNVKGESRTAALVAIAIAMAAAEGQDEFVETIGGEMGHEQEAPDSLAESEEEAGVGAALAAAAAFSATRALADLSREVITVVIHDIWPRFRVSHEFQRLMETKEMRHAGLRDLDGSVVSIPGRSSSTSRGYRRFMPRRQEAVAKVLLSASRKRCSSVGVAASSLTRRESNLISFSATAVATPRECEPVCQSANQEGGRATHCEGGDRFYALPVAFASAPDKNAGGGSGAFFKESASVVVAPRDYRGSDGGDVASNTLLTPDARYPRDEGPPSLRPLGAGCSDITAAGMARRSRSLSSSREAFAPVVRRTCGLGGVSDSETLTLPNPVGRTGNTNADCLRISRTKATNGKVKVSECFECSPVGRQGADRRDRSFTTASRGGSPLGFARDSNILCPNGNMPSRSRIC